MELNFINGKATLKQGRKTIAVVYYRPEFYPLNKIKAGFNPEFPYGLQMSIGFRECENLDVVKLLIKKFI